MSKFKKSELVFLSEQCHQKHLDKEAINYMKIKMSTLLNFDKRQILFQSFIGFKQPHYDLNDSCDDPNLSEKCCKEVKAKADIVNEAIEYFSDDHKNL